MKKIQFYLIYSLVVLALLVSCDEENFLEEQPKTIYTTSNAFEKSSQVDAQLITAYQAAYAMHGYGMETTTNASVANFLGGIGSDYSDIYAELAGNGASGWSNFASWTTVDDRFNNVWNAYYKMISYANLALSGAELVEWSNASEKEYAIAQAKFFRGYSYLRLAELFGGVPLVQEFTEVLKLDYTRATRTETYDFAIADLEDAASALPDYPKQDGRLAKGVANHFLSEAYLALGIESGENSNYQKAVDAAQLTISLHPLMTERFGSRSNPNDNSSNNGVAAYKSEGNVFYDLFQIGNYDYSSGNTEAVWTIEGLDYDASVSSGFGTNYGTYASHFLLSGYYSLTFFVGPIFRDMKWNSQYQETNANACPFDGNVDTELYPGKANSAYLGGMSIGRVYPTNYLIDKIWEGDLSDDMRNDPINICRDFICLDRDHSMYGKVVTRDMLAKPLALVPISSKIAMQDEWGWHSSESALHQKQYGRDWYAVRSAETYLLLAEAYLRNNQAALAADAINTIRNRANCSKLYTAGEIDIKTILDERARELQYEERRWPTLLRMGSKGVNDIMKDQLMSNAMYVSDIPYFTGSIDWTLFPIPKTVIDMNTEAVIEQNPGWQ